MYYFMLKHHNKICDLNKSNNNGKLNTNAVQNIQEKVIYFQSWKADSKLDKENKTSK